MSIPPRLVRAVRRCATLALALEVVTLAGPVLATDHPVSGASLTVRRSNRGVETVSFVSRDASLPFPTSGGGNDPVLHGALVEVVARDGDAVGMFPVPAGAPARPGAAGWQYAGSASVHRYRYVNRDAPGAPSAVRSLVLQQGRRLTVAVSRTGLELDGPQGAVAIRITVGDDRVCALFAGASVVRDQVGLFVGRNAPASALADCSDAALGTAPILAPGVFADPTCDDDFPLPPPTRPLLPPGPEELHRVTLDDPLAICNDGLPATMFVRRADPAGGHTADWILWLSGGSACGNAADCADRWCDRQQGPYSARTMSDRWDAWSETHLGIFSTRADNPFRTFNVAIVPYCSSDMWTGTRTVDVPASTSSFSGASYPAYRIAFHGRHIVDAALARLYAGVTSDDRRESLPSLALASRVIFSGSSAGGAGAINNASRVAALLRDGTPGVDVQLVADAIVRPYEPDPARNVSAVEVAVRRTVTASNQALWGTVGDASCLAAHPGDPDLVCTQPTHLLAHHVALRAFVQMDLEDDTVGPWAYDGAHDFGLATRELMAGLATTTLPFPEPVVPTDLAVFAPRCCHHVTLEAPEFYQLVVPAGGFNMNQTLWAWWNAGAVPALIDDGTAAGSGCPLVPSPCAP